MDTESCISYIYVRLFFQLILGWAENTRQTAVAPVKMKMLLLCENALLYFSAIQGYHPYVFPLALPALEIKMHDSFKMAFSVREKQRRKLE